jgi:hypothetical protein
MMRCGSVLKSSCVWSPQRGASRRHFGVGFEGLIIPTAHRRTERIATHGASQRIAHFVPRVMEERKSISPWMDSTEMGASLLADRISFVRLHCRSSLAMLLGLARTSTPPPILAFASAAKCSASKSGERREMSRQCVSGFCGVRRAARRCGGARTRIWRARAHARREPPLLRAGKRRCAPGRADRAAAPPRPPEPCGSVVPCARARCPHPPAARPARHHPRPRPTPWP